MKTLFRRSCLSLSLLFIMLLGGLAAVSVFAIVFQQSQALSSSAHAAATTVPVTLASRPLLSAPTLPPVSLSDSQNSLNASVTIQVEESTITPVPLNIATGVTATDISLNTSTALPINLPASPATATDLPRYSGTSSYPMTVTAEVRLAQTHVAGYEADIGGTRTAIAAESAAIYATLTAAPPTVTP